MENEYIHDITYTSSDSILVVQLPRETRDMSRVFIDHFMDQIKSVLPPGRGVIVIGNDVNIYEITGHDAAILKLKGLTN